MSLNYLQQLLDRAVLREDYEQAAVLRDKIRAMEATLGGMTLNDLQASLVTGGRPSGEEVRRTNDLEDLLRYTMPFPTRYSGHVITSDDQQRMEAAGKAAEAAAERLREAMERHKQALEQALREQIAAYFPGLEPDPYTMRGQGFTVDDTREQHKEYHFRGRLLLYVDYSRLPPVIVRM